MPLKFISIEQMLKKFNKLIHILAYTLKISFFPHFNPLFNLKEYILNRIGTKIIMKI